MKYTVLMGSPRKEGNTNSILMPVLDEIKKAGHSYDLFYLYDMKLEGCRACRSCQKDWTSFGCPLDDDLKTIFDSIIKNDRIIFATPIYTWYCTAPLKAVMDRLVYTMNKYYGDEKGPSLWAGKHLSLILTCGYEIEKGTRIFEEGIKMYCKHSKLIYDGMFAERDLGYNHTFMDNEKEARARKYALELLEK